VSKDKEDFITYLEKQIEELTFLILCEEAMKVLQHETREQRIERYQSVFATCGMWGEMVH